VSCDIYQVITKLPSMACLPHLLIRMGMTPLGSLAPPHDTLVLPVILDGLVVGEVEVDPMQALAVAIRTLKALVKEKVMTVCCVSKGHV